MKTIAKWLHQGPVDEAGDGPPFLGTWPRVYIAVLTYLAVLIVSLAWLSRVFAS